MTLRSVLSALAVFLLIGCKPQAPTIGRELPSNYAEGQKIFDARLKSRFPVGTPEERLVEELGEQGFVIPRIQAPDGVRYAQFTSTHLVFRTIWSVRWRADDGRVAEIWGVYGVQAP